MTIPDSSSNPVQQERISVLLVEDHSLVREGTREILLNAGIFTIVGAVGSGEEALACVEQLHPDIVLIDVQLPGISGIETIQSITEQYSDIRCIILSAYGEPIYVSKALDAGARGYLMKTVSSQELVDAIRSVASGGIVIDHSLSQIFSQLSQRRISDGPEPLTTRETDVLKLLAKGMSNKDIAASLNISLRTVESYESVIYSKLGVNSRTQAVLQGIEQHLIVLDTKSSFE